MLSPECPTNRGNQRIDKRKKRAFSYDNQRSSYVRVKATVQIDSKRSGLKRGFSLICRKISRECVYGVKNNKTKESS